MSKPSRSGALNDAAARFVIASSAAAPGIRRLDVGMRRLVVVGENLDHATADAVDRWHVERIMRPARWHNDLADVSVPFASRS